MFCAMSGKRIHLSVIDSTNSYTNTLIGQNGIEPWTVVSADFQAAGRGQRGKNWQVEPHKNLTFSVVISPEIYLDHQFVISFLAVHSLISTLGDLGLRAQFKWPNDILVGDKKIAGILIENQVTEGLIKWSVIGIGLNVNQEIFETYPWIATSIKNELKMEVSLPWLLEKIVETMQTIWKTYVQRNTVWDKSFALNHLYGLGQKVGFTQGELEFDGVIVGLNANGGLILEVNGMEKTYYTGEISFRRSVS